MKKTTKRALSFLLTIVMLVSTMSVGFFGITSLAASVAVNSAHNAVIAVPETVYMTPNGGAATVGQYYVNNTVSSGSYTLQLEANAANVNGYVQFYIPGAVDFQFSVNTVTSGVGDIKVAERGTTDGGSYENTPFGSLISNGYFAYNTIGMYIDGTGLNPGQTALAEWKFTVTMNDGSTRIYYAYTTLYSPHRTVGAVSESRRSGSYNNEISSWITGINVAPNGTWSPISTGGGDSTTAGYFKYDPLWTGLQGGSSQSSNDYVTASSTELYVEAKGTSGADGSQAIGYLGYITVDSSRYTNTNQIPNFKIGSDALRVEGNKKDSLGEYKAWYILGDSSKTISKDYNSTPSGWTQFVNKTDPQATSRNPLVPAFDVSTINGLYIHVASHGWCTYLSSKNYANAYVSAQFTTVNKATLRQLVLEGTSLNANNYISATWEAYRTELRAAAQKLGTPGATDVSTTNLEAKRNALQTTVTLNANGGTINGAATTTFSQTVGNAATYNYTVSSYTPVRTGYTFKGWSTSSTATSGSTSTVNAGLRPTLYATWEINKYNVVFDNLFDYSKFAIGTGQLEINERTDTGFTVTSTTGTDANTGFSYAIPVTPGKTYVFSADVSIDQADGDTRGFDMYINTLDANMAGETTATVDTSNGAHKEGNVYMSLTGQKEGATDSYIRFTAGATTAYIKVRFDANTAGNKLTVNNIRVYEDGTIADGVSYTPPKTVTYAGTYGTLPTPTRDGYEFLGWYKADGTQLNAGDTVGVGDVYVTSQWKQNGYTITWKNWDGTVLKTEIVAVGKTPTAPANPSRPATAQYTYTFTGWTPTVSAVTGDAEYTAQYSQTTNKYKVTWIVDGRTAKEEYVEYGTTPSFGSTPTKAADAQYTYTFTGWNTTPVAVTKDVTYTAQFSTTTQTYTVDWVVNGQVVETDTVEYGKMPEYNGSTPTKAANAQYTYTFDKWSPEVVAVTTHARYEATFTETLNKYTVQWVVDNEIYHTEKVEYGTTPTLPATPTKEADAQYTYTFKEWTPTVTAVTGDVTYNAKFTETLNKYTVTWVDENGTTVLYSADFDYGSMPVYGAENPTKAATAQYTYTFAGWDRAYETVTEDTTYTATYSSTVNKYTIEFVNEDGTVLQSSEVAYGETPVYTGAEPTKAATAQYTYVFTGWDPAIAKVTGEATYTAQFESTTNVYTVTWENYDGTVLETDENVPYGTTPTYDGATPTKPQTDKYEYTFADKWSPEVNEVTGDVTYTAQFTEKVRKYTITWVVDGTTVKIDEVEYDTVPVYTGATPTKEADAQYTYTFKDWLPAVVAVTGPATYVAVFDETVNTYTVTWVNDDDTVLETDTEVPYGATPSYDGTTPVKEKDAQYTYTFDKWTPEISAVEGNVTYKATYTKTVNNYTVTWKNENGTVLETDVNVPYGTEPSYDSAEPTKAATAEFTYTFAGWDSEVSTVTGDVTYTAKYTATTNEYTITWIVDGVSETTTVAYGAMPTHADPEKAATAQYTYTFAGWDPEVVAVTGPATYTAIFTETVNKYTVTWVDEDGTVLETDENVEYGATPAFDKANPTKAATAQYTYTFAGWEPTISTVTGDATYKATYSSTVNEYTIKFVDENGNVLQSSNVAYGVTPTAPAAPEKAADAQYTYTFKEWSPAIESVTGEATYTAVFDKTVNEYTITWIVDGEETTTTVAYGEMPTIADPEKAATAQYTYTFAGWDPEVVKVTGDATYTATFTETVNKYTVTWVDEDGTVLEKDENVEYGATPTFDQANPTKEATAQYTYTFAGWEPTISTVSGDATYKATYSSTVNEYTIKFVDENGNVLQSGNVAYGATPTAPADPSKAADAQYTYTFKEWSPAIESVTGEATYTAVFDKTVNEYTITWIVDGEETTTTVAYGEMPEMADPTKAQTPEFTYEFEGWTPAVVSVTGDATYTAIFTPITRSYKVTWVAENGTTVLFTEDVLVGATIPTKEVPYKDGFIGVWGSYPATMPTNDLTIKAEYYEDGIKVNWVIDDTTTHQTAVRQGQQITPEKAWETKAPSVSTVYTFIGWSETKGGAIVETFPTVTADDTEDKTYYAVFTESAREYTITWIIDGKSETTSVAYGSTPTHADPTKAADKQYTYTFTSWSPAIAPVTGDATYTAQFDSTVNKYTVTWIVDGQTAKIEDVEYGTVPTFGADPTKAGNAQYTYTFAGWSPAVTAVTDNATYTATFNATVNKYTVTWVDENGTVLETDTGVEYGTKPSFDKTEPTKAATAQYTYTFAGWDGLTNETTVTGDVTFKATYSSTVNKYTVTWVDHDGTELKSEELEFGATPVAPADPTRDATAQYTYKFDGWDKEITTVSGNVTYTATYASTVNSYDVEWVVDGETVRTDSVEYGKTPVFGEDPTKEATAQYTYTFAGWDPAVSAVTGKVTYTAQFSAVVNKYTVTWVDENGTVLETDTGVEYGTKPSFDKANPTKAATAQYTYTFAGWEGLTNEITVTGDVTFKATYSSTVNKYTVTWVNEDGTVLETDTDVEYGTMPSYDGATPVKAATAQYTYTFDNWTTAIAAVTGNVTYTAKYASTVNEYTITFVDENGVELQSGKVAYGETPAYTGETPVKAGDAQYSYVFTGWTPAIADVTEDATYTATFTQSTNTYTVTWVVEGKTVETDENVPYGTTPTFNGTTPTKAGNAQYSYIFAGWEPTVSGVIGNVEYVAVFTQTVNKYTVTWANEDGTTIKTEQFEYGTIASYSGETPAKAATAQYTFTFDGWDKEFAEVTGDVTYTATYKSTVNKYTVTWVVEGVTVETDENVEYGKAPSYDGDEPTKAGDVQYSYTFKEWTPEVSEVTGNVTYTATFTQSVNKYTITWIVGGAETTEQVEYGTVPTFTGSTDKAPDNTTVYTFAGWDKEVVAVTGNATYTATYSEADRLYTITWIVGDNTTTEQYKYNEVPSFKGSTDIPSTESTTYVFKGWDKEFANVTADATYTAVYDVTVKTHTITWVVGGQEIKQQWAYGTVPTFDGSTDKAPSATATYTFAGWDKTPVKVTGDATYTATYTETPRMYTVTWIVDGNVVKAESVAYNTVIPVPALPAEKEGYTVSWDNTVTIMPASDVNIHAIYTPKMYPVYWIIDGITVYSESVPFGSSIPSKIIPAKEGHTGKWVNVPETMPAKIVMIEAVYSPSIYTVLWKIDGKQATDTATYGIDYVLTLDVENLPADVRITVGGSVLDSQSYSYDSVAGVIRIYSYAITGNINIIAKSTGDYVNVISTVYGGTSSNKDNTTPFRTAYHTTITASEGYLLPQKISVYVDGIYMASGYTYDVKTGKLTINAEIVTGEVEIFAECVADPNYNPPSDSDPVKCRCSCHSTNPFIQFFFNIGNFFRKLFGMTQYRYCGCGIAHW